MPKRQLCCHFCCHALSGVVVWEESSREKKYEMWYVGLKKEPEQSWYIIKSAVFLKAAILTGNISSKPHKLTWI